MVLLENILFFCLKTLYTTVTRERGEGEAIIKTPDRGLHHYEDTFLLNSNTVDLIAQSTTLLA